ncbi:MAG: polysaccharide biosynthesis tyrosine autokinase [Actinomycetota bacterium]
MSTQDITADEGIQLREYLSILRARRWSIVVIAGAILLSTLFFSFRQTPIYESTTKVLVKPVNNPFATNAPVSSLINLDTEREIASSTEVAIRASESISPPEDPAELLGDLSVSVPTNTQVLEITFSDPSPIRAQAGAAAFANAYIDYKTEQATNALNEVRSPIEDQIRDLTEQLNRLNAAIAAQGAGATPEQQSRREELTSQLAVLRSQLAPLRSVVVDPGDILQTAGLPSSPSSPNHLRNAALALFVGLALGVGIAFLRERLDDRLRGRADLEQRAQAPVLAVIPKVAGWKKRDEARLTTVTEPRSGVAEAYRTLRTSVLFAAAQREIKAILVTSATAGEGKTTTAANLAVVLANAGKRVILVDADLRKPRIHRFLNLPNRTGLVNVLAGEALPWETLLDPGVDNLRVLPSGPVPTRPAELLGSEAMGELVAEFRQVADFVILDSPPVLAVSDALALAPLCQTVLYVSQAETTTRGAVMHARERLDQVGVEVLGAVLNGFDPSKSRTDPYYYYRYYYRTRSGPGGDGSYFEPHGTREEAPRPGRSSI